MAGKQKKKISASNQKSKQIPNKEFSFDVPRWVLPAILIFTALLYSRVLFNDFAWGDDEIYIQKNPFIRDFSFNGIRAIFSSFYFSNYNPLTTLSYLFEFKFYGLNPLLYHLWNVLLHLLNTWLVFKLTEKLSGKKITAVIVSLLFAIHPMHVESVAWISERKDVLYTSFYLLSLLFYLRYLDSGKKIKNYLSTVLLFICSLLSKPAAVTLPVLLILIDLYKGRKLNTKIFLEKLPFFLLSLLFGILTIMAQKSGGSIKNLSASFSSIERIFLFTYSVSFYIIKAIAPFRLSVMHYFPDTHGGALPFLYYASLPFLAIILWLVIKRNSFRKEIIFGVLFFLITISVMLQIIPVGNAIASERYTYVPYVGLFYIAGQWIATIEKKRKRDIAFTLLSLFVILFSYQTWNRISEWKNTETLCTEVIQKNPERFDCYYFRGLEKCGKGNLQSAILDFDKAILLKPELPEAYYNRGLVYKELGKNEFAMLDYNMAIKLKPDYAEAYNNMGMVNYESGDLKSAMVNYNKAISLKHDFAVAYNNRGWLYYEAGDSISAMLDYNKAILQKPDFALAYNNRATLKEKISDFDGAMKDINTAITLANKDAGAYHTRGNIKAMQKNYNGAIDDFNYSLSLNPNDNSVYYDRGMSYFYLNDKTNAGKDWDKALKLGNKAASEMIRQYCH
jgi:tetratricopeptide (TPR) repeat protein